MTAGGRAALCVAVLAGAVLAGCAAPAVAPPAAAPAAAPVTAPVDALAAERFRRMPPQDDVVGSADWYRPRVAVAGAPRAWPVSPTPEAAFADGLRAARAYDTLALVVVQDGRVVFEDYAPGIGRDQRFDTQSMHRGLLALAVLAAAEQGVIPSLDLPASRWLREWADPADPRSRITVRDLLLGQSGLVDPPFENRPDSPGMLLFIGSDLAGPVLSQPLRSAPGAVHRGVALDAQALGLLLERATGRGYARHLSERIWKPIGADTAWVRLDRPGGNTRTFCCIQATARDWARVGQLVLDRGRAGGRQVLSAARIDELLAPSPLSPAHAMFWLREPVALVPRSVAGDRPLPKPTAFASDGVVYFGGRGGQRVYVLTRQNAVVVRIGRIRNDFDDGLFLNPFIAALGRGG
jgi:CubicO group peptidase (beta-lactamase class C family)